jgi:hypothetical protein
MSKVGSSPVRSPFPLQPSPLNNSANITQGHNAAAASSSTCPNFPTCVTTPSRPSKRPCSSPGNLSTLPKTPGGAAAQAPTQPVTKTPLRKHMLPEANAYPRTPVYHTTNDVAAITSDDDEGDDPHAAAGDIVRAVAADCHRRAPAARHPPRSNAHTAATAIAAGSNLSLCSDFNPGCIDAGRGDGIRGRHGALVAGCLLA